MPAEKISSRPTRELICAKHCQAEHCERQAVRTPHPLGAPFRVGSAFGRIVKRPESWRASFPATVRFAAALTPWSEGLVAVVFEDDGSVRDVPRESRERLNALQRDFDRYTQRLNILMGMVRED